MNGHPQSVINPEKQGELERIAARARREHKPVFITCSLDYTPIPLTVYGYPVSVWYELECLQVGKFYARRNWRGQANPDKLKELQGQAQLIVSSIAEHFTQEGVKVMINGKTYENAKEDLRGYPNESCSALAKLLFD